MRDRIESARGRHQESEPQPNTVLYLVSDLHGLSGKKLDSVLKGLKAEAAKIGDENDSVYSIIMGDLPTSETDEVLVREFKSAGHDKTKLTFNSPEEERVFDEIVAKRGWRAGAYRVARLSNPELRQKAEEETRKINKNIAKQMGDLPNPLVFAGNAETNSPYGGYESSYEEAEIPFYFEPKLIDLGERAIIIWPSVPDPKSLNEAEKQTWDSKIQEIVRKFVQQLEGKKELMIVAHEQLFMGSKNYKENLADEGKKAYGNPSQGVNPSRPYIHRLISSLPAETKIGFVFGHLHSDEETIKQGTSLTFLESESGGMGKRLSWNPSVDGTSRQTREIDMFYVPQGQVGILTMGQEGFRFEKKNYE